MTIHSRWLCAALLGVAFPLAARAQPPDLQRAGVEMSTAALELQSIAQRTVAGRPDGDNLIRDLQSVRTEIDEFRSALDVGGDPKVVGRRFARLAAAHQRVQIDLQNMGQGLPVSMVPRTQRYERSFANLQALMQGF
jgi:hypothetical protein